MALLLPHVPSACKVFGLVVFFLGIVILLTPFTPGSILIVVGLTMMYGKAPRWWSRLRSYLKDPSQY